jgi:hypothetical protein
VNLGFNYGAELPDPEGLLQGPGKLMRHTQGKHARGPLEPRAAPAARGREHAPHAGKAVRAEGEE